MRTRSKSLRVAQFALFALSLFFCSCVYGPKDEKKSTLNLLNGEHYTQPIDEPKTYIPVVPHVQRVPKNTKISGAVFFKGDPLNYPANGVQVSLLEKDHTVTKVMTGAGGQFLISQKLADGRYLLRAENGKKKTELKIQVKGYEVQKLMLILEK